MIFLKERVMVDLEFDCFFKSEQCGLFTIGFLPQNQMQSWV